MKQKGLVYILVLFFIILTLGICGYLGYRYLKKNTPTSPLTTTQNQTSSWQTYANTKYGYEIKYPSSLSPSKTNNDLYLDFVSFAGNDENYKPFSIYVSQHDLEKEIETIRAQTEGHLSVSLTKYEDTVIGSFPAKILEYTPDKPNIGNKIIIVVISKGEFSYVINLAQQVSEQILSNFKFIQ